MGGRAKISLLIILLALTPFFGAFRTSATTSKLWVLIVCGAMGPSFHCDACYMYHIVTHHIKYDGINYLSTVVNDPVQCAKCGSQMHEDKHLEALGCEVELVSSARAEPVEFASAIPL